MARTAKQEAQRKELGLSIQDYSALRKGRDLVTPERYTPEQLESINLASGKTPPLPPQSGPVSQTIKFKEGTDIPEYSIVQQGTDIQLTKGGKTSSFTSKDKLTPDQAEKALAGQGMIQLSKPQQTYRTESIRMPSQMVASSQEQQQPNPFSLQKIQPESSLQNPTDISPYADKFPKTYDPELIKGYGFYQALTPTTYSATASKTDITTPRILSLASYAREGQLEELPNTRSGLFRSLARQSEGISDAYFERRKAQTLADKFIPSEEIKNIGGQILYGSGSTLFAIGASVNKIPETVSKVSA